MKKNKLIIMQIFIAFILICTSVYATSATLDISASATNVNKGDEVLVTLSLKDVGDNEKIQSVEGYINYDKNIIETLTVDNIQKDSDNTVKIGNETLKVEDLTNADPNNIPTTSAYVAFNGKPVTENNAKIVIDFNNSVTSATDLLKIKFKIKSDATTGEIKNAIQYSQFILTTESGQTEEITKSVNLTVKAVNNDNNDNSDKNTNTNTNTDKNTNTNTNSNTNKNTNANTNKNTNSNTNKNTNTNTNNNTNRNINKSTNKTNTTNTNTNTANKSLPAAGAKMIILPALVLIAVAYFNYVKYMKYKNI